MGSSQRGTDGSGPVGSTRPARRCRPSGVTVTASRAAVALLLCAGLATATPVLARPGGRRLSGAGSIAVTCTSPAHRKLAARLASGIRSALRGRSSTVALRVADRSKGLNCYLNTTMHFDSASVVKVTILGTLLREAMTQRRKLTAAEVRLATRMITESDNDAASALWAHVGRGRLRYFLGRAHMTQTHLGPGGYWGLTQITAHDELLLLGLLMYPNRVLDTASRDFALRLMARVIPAQRWGVPAGAPADLTVHVKNGWLPLATHGWRIHSIGCFTGHHRGYTIVVLTQDNPAMTYGISTIQRAAEVIHRQLNPAGTAVLPPPALYPAWGHPDEHSPARLGGR
jgi:Beta-lactamase enzyme family